MALSKSLDNATDKAFERISLSFSDSDIPLIFSILPLSNGDLILGLFMSDPLYMDIKSGDTSHISISKQLGRTPRLTTCLVEDTDKRIWIGTSGAGVFRYDPTVSRLERISGLSCEEICSIVIDDDGVAWISTLHGLNRYDVKDGSLNSFFASDGIGGNHFVENAATLMADGDIILGGLHGITAFNPKDSSSDRKLDLVFDDLILEGKIIRPDKDGVISSNLSHGADICLNHNDNNFTVTFSSLDFNRNNQIRYSYKLDGYNDDWIQIMGSREIHFSKVPAGRYVLRIRAAENSPNDNIIEKSLNIHIRPAWWNTVWARVAYVVIALMLITIAYRYRLRILKARREAALLAIEKENERHTNEMNIRFFTNVSHEFRTPLTMIAGPLTLLEKTPQLPENALRLIRMVKANSNRMLRLVNQLLDFNKLENDTLKLQLTPVDITGLINQTISLFEISIEEKQISLRKEGLDTVLILPIDSDKIEKIVANLLSNAIKFTNSGGEIICKLTEGIDSASIEISDDGLQIPDDSITRIFDRYYQVDNPNNYGTGIGLYYCKRLIEIHKGSISCHNRPEGGVAFTVILPKTEACFVSDHQTVDEIATETYMGEDSVFTPQELEAPTILLVDDDPSIVNYLKNILAGSYNLQTAFNATDALTISNEKSIDLIISDVAMPGKDGYTLCAEIKNEISTSHIPVILVTAKTTKGAQIEGLNRGADAYVTKPFDPDILKALIQSQLANRKRLQKSLGKAASVETITDESISEIDKEFLNSLYSLMEERIADSELDVNKIGEILSISRSKLHYKIKALTGNTPGEFFKKYKLNRAMELFKSGKKSVAEVSDLTGFTNQTIFTRNFRKQFGVTPSDFIKSQTAVL